MLGEELQMSEVSTQKDDRVILMIHNVDPEIRARFKAACARDGKTMREVVLKFLNRYANRHRKH